MLGLRFCARAFSSCGKRGPLFIAVRGPLSIAASLIAEHRLQMRRLSVCGSRAQLLRGTWDLPRPGLKSVCPALAGRLSTTAPPGKPQAEYSDIVIYFYFVLFWKWFELSYKIHSLCNINWWEKKVQENKPMGKCVCVCEKERERDTLSLISTLKTGVIDRKSTRLNSSH